MVYICQQLIETLSGDLQLIPQLIESFTVPVKHIRFEENKGLIYARRYGCEIATGDVSMEGLDSRYVWGGSQQVRMGR